MKDALNTIYSRLANHYGKTHWWPGDTPFEISVGAILTQNTAWTNVEKAIENLRRSELLTPEAMGKCAEHTLEEAIRPSGFFRLKTLRLKAFCDFLFSRFDGSMVMMAKESLDVLRVELLGVHGIGPETADDILLYACEKPVFVVDAYTRRIMSRHGIVTEKIGYEDLRSIFESNLPADVGMFQEYHGLIVFCAKDFCRKTPRCDECPLDGLNCQD